MLGKGQVQNPSAVPGQNGDFLIDVRMPEPDRMVHAAAGQKRAVGSATPSLESYYNCTRGKYKLLELPHRADDAKMPVLEMRDVTKIFPGVRANDRVSVTLERGEIVALLGVLLTFIAVVRAESQSLETLLAYLKSPIAGTRQDAAHKLGERRVRNQLAVEALAVAARKDEDHDVRAEALKSLGMIKDFSAMPEMIEALRTDQIDAFIAWEPYPAKAIRHNTLMPP